MNNKPKSVWFLLSNLFSRDVSLLQEIVLFPFISILAIQFLPINWHHICHTIWCLDKLSWISGGSQGPLLYPAISPLPAAGSGCNVTSHQPHGYCEDVVAVIWALFPGTHSIRKWRVNLGMGHIPLMTVIGATTWCWCPLPPQNLVELLSAALTPAPMIQQLV